MAIKAYIGSRPPVFGHHKHTKNNVNTNSVLGVAPHLSVLSFQTGWEGGAIGHFSILDVSDTDSGLWVNTLTASTEDILSVKWSLHYCR